MESFDFELKLVDSVTKNSERAARSVAGVDKESKAAKKALDGLGRQFERIGYAAEKARLRQNAAFERSVRSHMSAVDRMEAKLRSKSSGGSFGEGMGFDRMLSASFWGSIAANSVMAIGEGFVNGAKKAVEIFADGMKEAFKSASEEETLRVSERNTLGPGEAKAFRENIGSFDRLAPFDDSEIRRMMLQLRRAGLSQAASRQAFATAVDIGGGDQGAVGGILEQFKRIYTKQGIGKKQLMELLGNVGTTIPDFYKALGAKMHISAKAAEKKAEEGGLDPQLLMNMITEAQNKRQGGVAGTGGLRYAQTLAGEWKKITDLPGEYYKQLSDSPGYHKAVEALGALLDKLNPDSPTGQRIMGAVEDMFDKITQFIGDPKDSAESLADSIEQGIELAKQLVATFKDVADALMPSLDTIQDMVIGVRELANWKNPEALQAVERDRAEIMQNRKNRAVERAIRAGHEETYQTNVRGATLDAQADMLARGEFGPVNINAVRATAAKRTEDMENRVRKDSGSTVVIHQTNHVSVNSSGDDSSEAHEKAGHEVKKHLVSAGERAAAELGG